MIQGPQARVTLPVPRKLMKLLVVGVVGVMLLLFCFGNVQAAWASDAVGLDAAGLDVAKLDVVGVKWVSKSPSSSLVLSPEIAVDYIQRVIAADRLAYAQSVVDRARFLERSPQAGGVLDAPVQQDWARQDGLPLPCHLLRLGRDLALEEGRFTYGLISPWSLQGDHGPQSAIQQTAMEHVLQTGEPYRRYQRVKNRPHFLAFYPDRAVAQSCLDCHNHDPEHRSRYPDKTFQQGDIMGSLWIDLPLFEAN